MSLLVCYALYKNQINVCDVRFRNLSSDQKLRISKVKRFQNFRKSLGSRIFKLKGLKPLEPVHFIQKGEYFLELQGCSLFKLVLAYAKIKK